MRRNAGFTLTELLVAVAIVGVVVAAAMQSFMVQNQTYTVVDQVTETQQNMRAIAHLLERDARVTGFMVPESAALCGVDQTGAPDTLFLSDADALDPTNQVQAALGAEIVAGYNGATGSRTMSVDDVVLDGMPFYDTDGNAAADADFQLNAGAILVDADNPLLGTACGIVTAVNPAAPSITVDFVTTIGVPPPGDRLVLVPAHVYQIGAGNQLTRDGLPLANDVEDLQAAFFLDVDGDGQMTNPVNELPGSTGVPTYQSAGTDHRVLREIRVNLVVRTRNQDDQGRGLFQATENRLPIAVDDGFRRRVHTTTIRLRNVGFRGLAT